MDERNIEPDDSRGGGVRIKCLKMILKMRHDLQQIADVRDPGEGKCEQDTKVVEGCDPFNNIGEDEINREGKTSKKEGDLWEKIIYFDFKEFS